MLPPRATTRMSARPAWTRSGPAFSRTPGGSVDQASRKAGASEAQDIAQGRPWIERRRERGLRLNPQPSVDAPSKRTSSRSDLIWMQLPSDSPSRTLFASRCRHRIPDQFGRNGFGNRIGRRSGPHVPDACLALILLGNVLLACAERPDFIDPNPLTGRPLERRADYPEHAGPLSASSFAAVFC